MIYLNCFFNLIYSSLNKAFQTRRFSPRRLGLPFLLDEKSKQKNQDEFELAERSNKNSSSVHPLLLFCLANNGFGEKWGWDGMLYPSIRISILPRSNKYSKTAAPQGDYISLGNEGLLGFQCAAFQAFREERKNSPTEWPNGAPRPGANLGCNQPLAPTPWKMQSFKSKTVRTNCFIQLVRKVNKAF